MKPPTDYDNQLSELVELLIVRRGERAVTYARYQALKAGHRGEERLMDAWYSIADRAEQVWRVDPAELPEPQPKVAGAPAISAAELKGK